MGLVSSAQPVNATGRPLDVISVARKSEDLVCSINRQVYLLGIGGEKDEHAFVQNPCR